MKRDMDLIRELLLHLEAIPMPTDGETAIFPNDDRIAVPGHDPAQVDYHLGLLRSAHFLDESHARPASGINFRGLTWQGHDFLDSVRDPKIWAKTKDGALAAGGFTVDLLKDLAKGLVEKQIEERTGIKL